MHTNKTKRAYSLAEIMVVMLVLTIIFAACAPFLTKRRITQHGSDVWNYTNLTAYNAYSESGNNTNSARLFFGISPKNGDEANAFSPNSKLVIRSGPVTSSAQVQRQIQFRYGQTKNGSKDTDFGNYAGTILFDGRNMLMGGGYKNIVTEKTSTSTNIARQNVAIGYDALTLLQDAKNNVAVGNNALYSVKSDNTDYNVAVGYNAGYNTTSSLNTYVGAYAGYSTTLPAAVRNTAVGYLAGGGSSSSQISGYDNSYVGALAGTNITSGSRNVAVGFNALQKLTTGNDNIALGSEALANLTTGSYNVAIGYNACSQVTKGSYKTCIGANSGPHLGTTGTPSLSNPYMNATVDNIERTYIGSQPKYFGGDAVLELHNPPAPTSESDILRNGILQYLASTPSNTTTIVNGNLIVRGRVYFTSEAKLYQMYDLPGTSSTTGDFGLFGATGSSDVCASSAANYVFDCKANPFSVYSDRRLKNIGSKNLAGLDELAKIQVYNYTFKDDKNHSPHVGVIAQELQKVFPNSVFQGEDGFLRIKWDEMFYALINGVKELDKKIVALTTRTFKVESKISKLEKENVLLKSQVENLSLRVNKLKAEQ